MKYSWKFPLTGVCFFCLTNVMAQTNDKKDIEFGMELTSELQGTCAGKYNYVNLLRLNTMLPIVSPRSENPRATRLSFEIASLSTFMTAKESIGGEMQTFSNLDAGNIPFALSVCNLALGIGQRHSLFLGIRNMNEDYFCSNGTSFFTNSSCGIYPTISANYPIANYPVASVGVHYCYDAAPFRVQASIYNGIGYYRFIGQDNIFRVCPKSDGVFGLTEVSYTHEGRDYYLGYALYCKEGGISATPWFYTEQCITTNLTLLAGYSHSFTTDAECKDFVGCGVLYQFRKYQWGAFTDYASFIERNEFATELTCKISLSRYLDIQPTVHLITYDGRLQCAAMLRMALCI